jgi:hypothetical protein
MMAVENERLRSQMSALLSTNRSLGGSLVAEIEARKAVEKAKLLAEQKCAALRLRFPIEREQA